MKEVEITNIKPENWEIYRDIRLRALKEEPQAFGSTTLLRESKFTKENWLERTNNRDNLVAFRDGKAVGTMRVYMEDIDGANVANIAGAFVSSEARGHGVGAHLLEELLRWIKEDTSIKRVLLTVNKEQTPAVKLYEKFGFKVVDEKPELMGDGLEHVEFHMELKI